MLRAFLQVSFLVSSPLLFWTSVLSLSTQTNNLIAWILFISFLAKVDVPDEFISISLKQILHSLVFLFSKRNLQPYNVILIYSASFLSNSRNACYYSDTYNLIISWSFQDPRLWGIYTFTHDNH
jgi:hypothetical protein